MSEHRNGPLPEQGASHRDSSTSPGYRFGCHLLGGCGPDASIMKDGEQ